MTALARTRNSCKRQTCHLVREGAPHQQPRTCVTIIKIWSWAQDGCLIPRQTGRETVERNITPTSTYLKIVNSNKSLNYVQLRFNYQSEPSTTVLLKGVVANRSVRFDPPYSRTMGRHFLLVLLPTEKFPRIGRHF
jgi:hypothetical protein